MELETILKNQHGKDNTRLAEMCLSKHRPSVYHRKNVPHRDTCRKWEERKKRFRGVELSLGGGYVTEERLKKMDEKLDLLLDRESPFDERIIVLRAIDKEQARAEILDLFKKEGRLFDSDVATKLRLDLGAVIEIIDELEEEGLIGDIKDE